MAFDVNGMIEGVWGVVTIIFESITRAVVFAPWYVKVFGIVSILVLFILGLAYFISHRDDFHVYIG